MSAVLDVCSFSRQPAVLARVAEQAAGSPGLGSLVTTSHAPAGCRVARRPQKPERPRAVQRPHWCPCRELPPRCRAGISILQVGH